MAYIQAEKIDPNFEATFGKLLFQRIKYQDYERDIEGNEILDQVTASHLELYSSVQHGEIAVVLTGDVQGDFKYGDEVKMEGITIDPYAIVQDTSGFNVNKGFSTKIKSLVKVTKAATRTSVPSQNNNKSEK
ncbi:DUF961 family protein [Lapidilactobacillus mulanensis]|uniref:DUF961 family protein n=1 Tax=Lapidilactobacillus mulanensis TaxID=2485999 RepID=A0ABW4DNS5_9LACO|nr:DUF961 family protein [Lapidilactobacillus mulanensis]